MAKSFTVVKHKLNVRVDTINANIVDLTAVLSVEIVEDLNKVNDTDYTEN